MSSPTYSVTLHHLAPGATAAGLAYPDVHLTAVTVSQLRELLDSMDYLAQRLTPYEPSMPEIRVKAERDAFVIRTRHRQLWFVGWEVALRGEDHSVDFILATITGSALPAKAAPRVERNFATTPSFRASQPPGSGYGSGDRGSSRAVKLA